MQPRVVPSSFTAPLSASSSSAPQPMLAAISPMPASARSTMAPIETKCPILNRLSNNPMPTIPSTKITRPMTIMASITANMSGSSNRISTAANPPSASKAAPELPRLR